MAEQGPDSGAWGAGRVGRIGPCGVLTTGNGGEWEPEGQCPAGGEGERIVSSPSFNATENCVIACLKQ